MGWRRRGFWAEATVPTNALGRKVESTDEELEAACMAGMEGANRRKQRPSYPGLFNLKVMGSQGSQFQVFKQGQGCYD